MKVPLDLGAFIPQNAEFALSRDSSSPLGEDGYLLTCGPEGGVAVFDASDVDYKWKSQAKHIVFDVYHELDYTLGVVLRISEAQPGARDADKGLHIVLGVLPGLLTRLSFPMWALDGQTIFLPRTPGRLKGTCFGTPVDASNIASLGIGVMAATGEQKVWLSALSLTDEDIEYPMPMTSVVDELGQWTAKDWHGKTASVDDLSRDLESYLVEAETSAYPQGWSRYGGWLDKSFEATGFFRTQHDGRRWWLVDPEGYAFFSSGMDCVRPEVDCRVQDNESLFAWLPPQDGEYADAWGSRGSFSFSTSNAIRVWGKDWRSKWNQMTTARLKDWGFNTIANWSDPGFYRGAGIPYVWQPNGFPSTSRFIYRDFPDVFSQEYLDGCRAFAQNLLPYKDDPYMIGYFMRNEPHWAFGENNIAEYLLESGAGLASLQRLLAFFEERYSGDIGKLSSAWGRTYNSFEELVGTKLAAELSAAASKDLWDFTAVLVRQYLEPLCKECRAVDPNHLNLGIRYAWLSSEACLAGSDLFDVFSINMYQMAPTEEVIKKASEKSGLPVMIGEYHWGALDSGLPSTGLRAVESQAERGVAYAWYLERGASMPWLVGAHYFQLNDQPVLGRFDGENFQIGFVDICHRPYFELVEAAKRTHTRMYLVADGKLPASDREPIELPRQGF